MCDECIIRYGESKTTSAVKLLSAMVSIYVLSLSNIVLDVFSNTISPFIAPMS